jgi:hypothetical protein
VRPSNPHKKFVSLELFSESQFSLRFNRFYAEEIKQRLQKIPRAKFYMDFRAWIIELPHYQNCLRMVEEICESMQIHVEAIPDYCVNLVKFPVPWTLPNPEPLVGLPFNYSEDQSIKARVPADLPSCFRDALMSHQVKGI